MLFRSRDASIGWLFNNTLNIESLKQYVDPSLAVRDASISWLYDNTYSRNYIDGSLSTKASISYVDGSLVMRDSSIQTLFDDKLSGTFTKEDFAQVAVWDEPKSLTGSNLFIFDLSNNRLAIGSNQFTADDNEKLLVNSGITDDTTNARFTGQVNDFMQIDIRNNSNAPSASADVVVSTSDSTDEVGYVDLGINSPNYNLNIIGTQRDAYLYSLSANLLIGNASIGQDIVLFTNDVDAYANERMRITSDGSILVGKPTSKNNLLEINGNVNIPLGSNYKVNNVPLYTNAYIDGSLNAKVNIKDIVNSSALQLLRTTTFATTPTYSNIVFDTVVVESDPLSLTTSDTSTERILIEADGIYLFSTSIEVTATTSQQHGIRVTKNDQVVVPGSQSLVNTYSGEIHEITSTFIFDASAGDYIIVQGASGTAGTFSANAGCAIVKLDGVKGKDGKDGSIGPAGSGSTINVADEGSVLPGPFDKLDFRGTNVTATTDGSTARITVAGGVYGQEFQLASSTAVSTTTATTPQTKVTMTTTNLPSGTYRITASWMWQHTGSITNSSYFDLTLNGTPQGVTTSTLLEPGDLTDWGTLVRNYYVTLSGVNTIALRYWSEGNTTGISDAHIELIRVS